MLEVRTDSNADSLDKNVFIFNVKFFTFKEKHLQLKFKVACQTRNGFFASDFEWFKRLVQPVIVNAVVDSVKSVYYIELFKYGQNIESF